MEVLKATGYYSIEMCTYYDLVDKCPCKRPDCLQCLTTSLNEYNSQKAQLTASRSGS